MAQEVANCAPFLEERLAALQPRVVIIFGKPAAVSMLCVVCRPNRAAPSGRRASSYSGILLIDFGDGTLKSLSSFERGLRERLLLPAHSAQGRSSSSISASTAAVFRLWRTIHPS